MTITVEPSPELLELCKYWIPFLQKKHQRAGMYNKQQLDIFDISGCMVAEAFGFSSSYSNCIECCGFASHLDAISENNRSPNITPKQIDRMIRKGNSFAIHFMKKHAKAN